MLTSFSITPAGSMLLARFSRPGCCFCILNRATKRMPALAIEVEKLSTEAARQSLALPREAWKKLRGRDFLVFHHRNWNTGLQACAPHSKSLIARDEAFHHVQHRCRKRFSSPPQSITQIRRRTLGMPMKKFSPMSSRDIAG